jgi:hypothetical protein
MITSLAFDEHLSVHIPKSPDGALAEGLIGWCT